MTVKTTMRLLPQEAGVLAAVGELFARVVRVKGAGDPERSVADLMEGAQPWGEW